MHHDESLSEFTYDWRDPELERQGDESSDGTIGVVISQDIMGYIPGVMGVDDAVDQGVVDQLEATGESG